MPLSDARMIIMNCPALSESLKNGRVTVPALEFHYS